MICRGVYRLRFGFKTEVSVWLADIEIHQLMELPMYWMLLPLRRYVDFRGRSRRKEYWMFVLGQVFLYFLLCMPMFFMGVFEGNSLRFTDATYYSVRLILLVSTIFFVPSIAVAVRRFHDMGKSGWFYLLGFIPVVGGVVLIIFMCIEGDRGENAYGADPREVKKS